ncbi:MAG: hypothetical protein AAGD38_00745 [Acidobacteriota bacterium]
MLRVTLTFLALIACLGAMPADAQTVFGQDIIGFFEGPVDAVGVATGAVRLTGWVLTDDPAGIRRVIVRVDGEDIRDAAYGRVRPDVENAFPGRVDSAAAGFGYILDSTAFTNEVHTVDVEVQANNGESLVLNSYQLLFQNNAQILVPFGEIEFPERNAVLYGNCVPRPPASFDTSICSDDGLSDEEQQLCDASFRRYSVVEGWALDMGDIDAVFADEGIGYVELLIDGAIHANTRTGCTFVPEAGGFSNCYGLPRNDIENSFPFTIDGPNSGFRFIVDIGALIAESGRTQGQHTFTIRAGDLADQVANIDEFPVFWSCIQNLPNEAAFGAIETPRLNRVYAGLVKVEGWALDGEGVRRIQVWVDGEFVTFADYAVDSRPNVAALYPGYPDSALPAYRAYIDTTQFADGVRQILVFAVDEDEQRSLIGRTEFFVNNEF